MHARLMVLPHWSSYKCFPNSQRPFMSMARVHLFAILCSPLCADEDDRAAEGAGRARHGEAREHAEGRIGESPAIAMVVHAERGEVAAALR
eukprot:6193110-Pleurochrysis_carterae.AAC.2